MNKQSVFLLLVLLVIGAASPAQQARTYAQYVDPFIGTAGAGHTFPGATVPFGLVKASPETGYAGWNYCSGYRYEDSAILGFSHTHLSGTGWMDLGDILLMPFTGNDYHNIKSSFNHRREKASPGYYSVELDTYQTTASLTTTAHSAFHQYEFKGNAGAHLLIDLRHGLVGKPEQLETHVVKSSLVMEDSKTISGYTVTKGWAGEKQVYFVIAFRNAFESVRWLSDSLVQRNQRVAINFGKQLREQQVKVGLSTVSIENAKENLLHENKGWDFTAAKDAATNLWEKELRKIQIQGDTKQLRVFYTALYHTMIHPDNIADVNGEYRGADNKVYQSPGKTYYSTFSLWDTYRALHPLFTIIQPERDNDMVASMLAHYDVNKYLPVWTLWGHENNCMIANHAIPVVVDAYLKGISNYDVEKAFEAIVKTATVSHPKSDWEKYDRYGYLPSDSIKEEAVSRTLESAYDDWCIAKMAKVLGRADVYQTFLKRSRFYANLFDTTTGFMRSRYSNGEWVKPFHPLKISHAGSAGGDYTEGNAWQYSWHVQQDIPGLVQLMGGRQPFARKLDTLFSLAPTVEGDGLVVDVTGLIGQYVQGNEPSHHVAYLYNYVNEPWKTQEKINAIINTLYSDQPNGLSGNDDCGQMSAWYIFSALGFYPVDPVSGKYDFGVPAFDRAVIRAGTKPFTVITKKRGAANKYIQQVKLNGQVYTQPYLLHKDLVVGGTLEFIMGPDKINPFK